MLSLGTPAHAQGILAAWDFKDMSATTSTSATPATISATVGSGTIDVSAFGLGSPQGTSPERTAFTGTTDNSFPGGDTSSSLPSQAALALANNSANGKSVIISFSMLGYMDLEVSFATRGTSTGFNIHTWAWSTDGSTYTTLDGNNTATTGTSWLVRTVSFSGTGLDDALNAYLRLTVEGATGASGNNRLDNIQLRGAPVPEPSSFILGALGLLIIFAAHRRRRTA